MLEQNRSKLVRTRRPLSRVSIVEEGVLQITQYGPNEVELVGTAIGETNLTLWFADAAGQPSEVLRYLVRVRPNPDGSNGSRFAAEDLQTMINELFPDSQIELLVVGDKLVLRGQARDSEEATRILTILRGRLEISGKPAPAPDLSSLPLGLLPLNSDPTSGGPDVNLGPSTTVSPGNNTNNPNLINLLRVPGEQQVLLKVRVAEISRTALRQIGVDFTVAKNNFFISNSLGGGGNIRVLLDNNDVTLLIRALESNSYAKVLAEPNLVAISGQAARFIAGGQFAVPTTVGVGGVGAATTFFQGFGTQLLFTPTVIDKDRIRLRVAPTLSSLNTANSVGGIPGLNTRSVFTTVDMREGQWLAIAGLLQDQQSGNQSRVPLIGSIPLVGNVFRSSQVTREETELLILVSPQLIHPLDYEQLPPSLPGMDVTEPSPLDFYAVGMIEGQPGAEHRSTVWPKQKDVIRRTLSQAKKDNRYGSNEKYYVTTPQGFSE